MSPSGYVHVFRELKLMEHVDIAMKSLNHAVLHVVVVNVPGKVSNG